jgi:glycosyltransferase involved in cell wall biosynthesis
MSSVDVIIPCYNYARFLPESVRSVLSQEGVKMRVLVIDDCSTDNCEDVGRELAAVDSRVEYRRHLLNRGHIKTFNEGLLEWASSEYSLLLSADDALAPGALSRAAGLMDRHPEVGMTYGMALVIPDRQYPSNVAKYMVDGYRLVPGAEFLRHCFAFGNAVPTPTAVVRTRVQQRLGGYTPDLPHSGDMEMWMRFAANGPIGVIRAVQAYYRMHSDNMSLRYYRQALSDRREIICACEKVLADWGARFEASKEWRELMCRRIGRECCWMASSAFDHGDTEAFRACIDFARSVYPRIRYSAPWWKARARGAVGPHIWREMLPAWERLRAFSRRVSADVPVHAGVEREETGWWPV